MSLRDVARRNRALWRFVRRRSMLKSHPDWSGVRGSVGEQPRADAGTVRPNILIATGTGGLGSAATVETILAMALRMRGANVSVLLCDGAVPACQLCARDSQEADAGFDGARPWMCSVCFEPAAARCRSLGLTVHRYSQFIDDAAGERVRAIAAEVPADEIATYEYDGVPVGQHALAGALRFYGRGDLEGESGAEGVLRRYFEAALRTAVAVNALIDAVPYECAVFHHGIYVPQGVVGGVCRKRGVRVVNWAVAYRDQSFIFSHGDTHHHTMVSEPVETWSQAPLSPEASAELQRYLRARWTGREDWITFVGEPDFDLTAYARSRGLDDRPRIGLLTSVLFDARIHYPSNAFTSMMDWIIASIDYFATRPDLQLVIRVHPAEVRKSWPSSQRVADEISRRRPRLPSNVIVVRPDDPISTYGLMETCDSVLIYNTKTGIELTAAGIPVIVAGEAWIRGKGFSRDASTAAEYHQLLEALPVGARMPPSDIARAQAYAYHVFFRLMIPLNGLFAGADGSCHSAMTSWDQLAVGRDPGVDLICDGILNGSPFVFTPG